jgi:hypothetical protein
MLDNNFLELIKLIATKMKSAGVKWALTSGANLTLQGLDVKLDFIDILVKNEELDTVEKTLNDFKEIDRIKLENGEGEEIIFVFKNLKIRVCGEYDQGYFLKFFDDIIYLEKDGVKIPCFKLKNEMDICKRFSKTDKLEMIKNFLKQ